MTRTPAQRHRPPAPAAPTPKQMPWPTLMLLTLLALATLLAYANAFRVPFLFDDQLAILENPTIRDPRNWRAILHPPTGGITVHARPLINLAHALNHALHGFDVRGYHALNLAVHILNGWLLFGITRRVLRNPRDRRPVNGDNPAARATAFAIALLWLLHPLATQAVTYISQRAESIAAGCYLLALYALTRSAAAAPDTRHPLAWAIAAVAAAALGMTAKETVITLPLVALLFDRAYLAPTWRAVWQHRRALHLALWATTAIRLLLLRQPGMARDARTGFGSDANPWHYLLTQAEVIPHYLRLAVWPRGLCFDYQWPWATNIGAVWPGFLLTGGLVAAALYAWHRAPRVGFPLLAFFLILAPTSSIMPIADAAYDHRMYLPLAAAIAAGLAGLQAAAVRFAWPPAPRIAALAVLAVALGLTTHARNRLYTDPMALWEDTLAKRPDNARAWYNRGHLHEQAGRFAAAMADFDRAIALKPDYAGPHYNRGNLHLAAGRPREAIADLSRAIALQPAVAQPYYNRGLAHRHLGRPAEALADFRAAADRAPTMAMAHFQAGNVLADEARFTEAIAAYTAALQVAPTLADAWHNRAAAYALASQPAEARRDFDQYRRLGAPPAPELEAIINALD